MSPRQVLGMVREREGPIPSATLSPSLDLGSAPSCLQRGIIGEIPGGNYIEKDGPIPGTTMSPSLDSGMTSICLPDR